MSSREERMVIDEVFEKRVRGCMETKKERILSCRVIAGEADFLLGFIVGQVWCVLVKSPRTWNHDRYKERHTGNSEEVCAERYLVICGVYEKWREKCRAEEWSHIRALLRRVPHGWMKMVKYQVIKTVRRWFSDQKYNRLVTRSFGRNARVLNRFYPYTVFCLNAVICRKAERSNWCG